jgi:Phenylalanyl-tRNA synthetase alpha subunit
MIFFASFKSVASDERKEVGQAINRLKQAASEKVDNLKDQAASTDSKTVKNTIDLTRPGYPTEMGSRHPISIVRNKIVDIFSSIGFGVSEGPEIEDDWHNFTALNLPDHHPARDMQDTFFYSNQSRYLAAHAHLFGSGASHGAKSAPNSDHFSWEGL